MKRKLGVLVERKRSLRKYKPGQEIEFEIDEICKIRELDYFIEREVSNILDVDVIIPAGASDYELEDKPVRELVSEMEVYYFYYSAGFEGVDEYEGLSGEVYVNGVWDKEMGDDEVLLMSGVIVIKEV